ncbi:hypothetical protein GCM10023259_102260 [Thermocatellispora tengchongensis]
MFELYGHIRWTSPDSRVNGRLADQIGPEPGDDRGRPGADGRVVQGPQGRVSEQRFAGQESCALLTKVFIEQLALIPDWTIPDGILYEWPVPRSAGRCEGPAHRVAVQLKGQASHP